MHDHPVGNTLLERVAAAILAATLASAPASGQEVTTFEFSFSNPGARSLALGGAFVALADDATAAFANPAGLVQLIEPEISIEGRSLSYSTPFFDHGRFEGSPTGRGLDTQPGLGLARSDTDLENLSFLSFVYPRRKWTLAFYRHWLADFEFAGEVQGFFGSPSDVVGSQRRSSRRGAVDLELLTYGVAGGFKLSESLSLGVGLTYFDVTQRIDQQRYLWDEDTRDSFFAESSFLSDRQVLTSERLAEGGDWGFTAGFLWHLSERWRLGGSARTGPEVEDGALLRGGPEVGRGFPGVLPGTVVELSVPLTFPDVFGLGVAFRSADGRFTASCEWDRVEYSDLLDNDPDENEFIPDADEIHLGLEVVFPGSTPVLALRLGAWLDPEHRIHALVENALSRALDELGSEEIHYSVGFGAVFERVQIDLGADLSSSRDTVSASAIYRF